MSDAIRTAGDEQVVEVTVRNEHGIHARPAAMFVQTASRFACEIFVEKDKSDPINGKSIMGLMTLQASLGTKLRLRARGPDANDALGALARLFESKFEEG